MRSPIFGLFFLLLSCWLLSCSKTDAPQPPKASLTINSSIVSFPSTGGKDSIIITSTEKWKLTKPETDTWLRSSLDSGGPGTTTVYLESDANVISTARTSSITITSVGAPLPPVQVVVSLEHEVIVNGFSNHRAKGGETITIFGRGYSRTLSENQVTINGKNAIVNSATNTNLTVTVPSKAGSGPVIVRVNNKADTSERDLIYNWVGVVTIIAGGENGEGGFLDGKGTAARFSHPQGICFDANGNLYVADYNNYKVRKIGADGMVATIPGRFPGSDPASNTDYGLPTAVSVDPSGNLYVCEFNSNGISKVTPYGTVTMFAGGNAAGLVNGAGTAASFYWPADITVDGSGNVFVADMENLCVRKITPAGVVTTFAGGQWGYQDGTGPEARFNRPIGMDIDKNGNLYVADFFNNRIRKITPAGIVTTLAGIGTFGSEDGHALTEASFQKPFAVAVAPDGTLYVSENSGDKTIRMIGNNGKVETIVSFTVAGTGAPFAFSSINGMKVHPNGTLYATDYYNNRICMLTYQ